MDGNGNGVSDHIWWIARDLGGGWFECLDNQSGSSRTRISADTYKRRLDGKVGKTAAREILRILG